MATIASSTSRNPFADPSYSSNNPSIRLRNLPSRASTSSSTVTNPFESTTSLSTIQTQSTLASTTASLLPSSVAFSPTRRLHIAAVGKSPISLPTPAGQLRIPIYCPSDEGVTGKQGKSNGPCKYVAIREKKSSGTFLLYSSSDSSFLEDGTPEDLGEGNIEGHPESGPVLGGVTFSWGPGEKKDPVVRIGTGDKEEDDAFQMRTKLFTRSGFFETSLFGSFEWRYAGRKERALIRAQEARDRGWEGERDINTLLVLERTLFDGSKEKIAQLVRGEGTRTENTKGRDWGNGGLVEMCFADGDGGEGLMGREGEMEVLVVTTCLVMLQREVDRLRAIQIGVMSGGGGGY